PTTELFTLSLHDALPIWLRHGVCRTEGRAMPNQINTTVSVLGLQAEAAAQAPNVPAVAWPDPKESRLLGHDIPRLDGPDKVTGRDRKSTRLNSSHQIISY